MRGNNTGGRNSRDYRESSLRIVLLERGPHRNWNDVARWLHSAGRSDPELKPSDVQKMLNDMDQLVMDNVPFTTDPGQAFNLAHEHRKHAAQHGHRRRQMPHRIHKAYPRV